jgi:hypothetical protein
MPSSFLNSREDALLVWTGIILVYAVSKDTRGIGGSFLGVVRAVLAPKLLMVFGSASLYSALLVYGAAVLDVWHSSALKETIYWFLGTGVALVGQAVVSGTKSESALVRKVFRRVVTATVLVEFAANLYAFALPVELVLTAILLVFVMMQAYAPYDKNVTPVARKFINGVLIVIGLVYLVYFLVRALTDLGAFLTREHAEDILVGPGLTLCLLPLLYAFAWWSRREQQQLHNRFVQGLG